MEEIMIGKIKSHKELIVWNKAMKLVEKVYALTKKLPREEIYGLTSQIRRASVSTPTNITEGYQRNHRKEYLQFLYIAKASAYELETLLLIAERVHYLEHVNNNEAYQLLTEVLKMLNKMVSMLRKPS